MTYIACNFNQFMEIQQKFVFVEGVLEVDTNSKRNNLDLADNTSRLVGAVYLTGINPDGEVIALKINVTDKLVSNQQLHYFFDQAKLEFNQSVQDIFKKLSQHFESVQYGFITVPQLKEYLEINLGCTVNLEVSKDNPDHRPDDGLLNSILDKYEEVRSANV